MLSSNLSSFPCIFILIKANIALLKINILLLLKYLLCRNVAHKHYVLLAQYLTPIRVFTHYNCTQRVCYTGKTIEMSELLE
jgi:hypothetical protein